MGGRLFERKSLPLNNIISLCWATGDLLFESFYQGSIS